MHIDIIKSRELKQGVCLVDQKIMEELGVKENENYILKCGALEAEVIVIRKEARGRELFICEDSFNKLKLINKVTLNIWRKDKVIQLGPVLGVFLNTKYMDVIEKDQREPILYNTVIANEVAHCLLYFFSIDHINWFARSIKGYWFDTKENKWKQDTFPMPDVIYDRGASFYPEQKILVKHIREQFRKHSDVTFINSRDYLGKWQLFKRLNKNSQIRPYLPDTVEYRDFKDLEEMIEKHRFIFLKSFYGSRGLEVMSFEKVNNEYVVVYYKNGLLREVYQDLRDTQDLVSAFVNNKKFILQQGIKIMKYEGRNFDTRVLMQKNHCGKWTIAYNRVSIAKKDYSITTIESEEIEYADFYPRMKDKDVFFPTDAEVRTVSLEIMKAIEKEFGTFAEIGMDITVDTQGRIWFIEANTKPEKYPTASDLYIDEPSYPFLSILNYTKYLIQGNMTSGRNTTEVKLYRSSELRPHCITVPRKIFERLDIHQNISVQVGLSEENVTANLCEESTGEIYFCPDLMNKLSLIEGTSCQLVVEDNSLRFGPVIAAFLSNGHIRRMHRQTPKFRHREFAIANKYEKTILYFFSIKDVDFLNQKINGTYYNEMLDRWERRKFPFPDILYDRGGGVLPKQKIKSHYIREQLALCPEIITLNPQYFFDKWDLHEKLSKHEKMQPYLPITNLFTDIASIEKMFDLSHKLYIKDCLGSNGRDIFYVEKLRNGKFIYSYFKGQVFSEELETVHEVAETVRLFFANKKVLIQQAIPLITIDDKKIDLRATLQRDINGDLQIHSYPVRMGVRKSPITSTQSGSKVFEFDVFFAEYFKLSDDELKKLKEKVERFLRTCYVYIEKEYGTFGELGIDFAFDENLNLWFIESNAKPGYDAMYKSCDRSMIEKVFQTPLQYCKRIGGFI
ncbi:YheC/YheD family endospore coat-associated protein [Heliorestis convoluta]|uniref:YheC/YheD family protein, putative n=1 Tax=Heliorestis convoluta TaxID=356322 RepID=A0A5Q2N4P0_9FIRM|nr:YheC/YheD family protein [Heliorestis convoluta]QGG48576.1 YheC/YheD family protein, putative [Heliorestis convoluta]